MAKDPDERYPTARALAYAARLALTTTPPVTTEMSTVPAQLATHPPIVTTYPYAAPAPEPRRPLTWAAIVVPLVLVLLLVGAGAFADTQVLRPDPRPSSAAPHWQPYVDYARQFTVWLTSLSPQSADSDIQRILDGSTGAFHDEFAKSSTDFQRVVTQSNVSSQGTVNAAALDSIVATTAQVLVASTSKVTNNAGAAQDPRSYRLIVQVEKIGDAYKVSKVEFVP